MIEKGKLVTAFGNSVLYAVTATLIGMTLSALAAYVLSRNRTRFNRWIYFFIIMGIAMPTNFVTLTKVMQLTHLINTQTGHHPAVCRDAHSLQRFPDLRLYRRPCPASLTRRRSSTAAVRCGCSFRVSSIPC